MILERNLRDEVKKYVSQELPKYAEAPLCHLIPLLTSDSAERSLSTASIYRFIWSRFLLNDHILQTDRTSLNLVHAIWSGFSNIRPQRRFLRQLIREIGYKIQPDAYSATCLCVLKCIVDLRWGAWHSGVNLILTNVYFTSPTSGNKVHTPPKVLLILLVWRHQVISGHFSLGSS